MEDYFQLKYIDLQHHSVKELVEDGAIWISYYSNLEMAVDIFTKQLDALLFFRKLKLLRLYNLKSHQTEKDIWLA